VELKGKVCLIAGGTGAIGAAVVKRFKDEGAEVAITHLSSKPSTSDKPQDLQFLLDINNWEQINAVLSDVTKQLGAVQVLVNCTGVLGPLGPTNEIPREDWIRAIEVNLIGSFNLTRAILPAMIKQRHGKIIHFSGGGAAYGRPFCTAYSASKAALVRFTESLAEELRDQRIDINAIAPGPVYSRMWDQMRRAGSKAGPSNVKEVQKMEETGGVSSQRAADLAVFLASERSDGLSGRLISAIYDDWANLDSHINDVMKSEAGTLRRIPLSKTC
jgi:NAD(P)-dependent dehydrogenase (short-subunit alcohol dehydrogenase family)